MLNNRETHVREKKKVIIVGRDLTDLHQKREFECIDEEVKQSFSNLGYEVVLIHADEEAIEIIAREKPTVTALLFGGQRALRFLDQLSGDHTNLLGLDRETAHQVENKENFKRLIARLGLKQLRGVTMSAQEDLKKVEENITFPAILFSSIAEGKEGDRIDDLQQLREKIETMSPTHFPIFLEEYLNGTIKCSLDVISDGKEVFIPLPLEYISREAHMQGPYIMPNYRISKATLQKIYQQVNVIACFFNMKGIFNIQFAVKGEHIYVGEMHCGISVSIPLISQLIGMPLIEIAIKCMLGESLKEQRCVTPLNFPFYCMKESCTDIQQMKNGEVFTRVGDTPYEAYVRAQIAASYKIPLREGFKVLLSGIAREDKLIEKLLQLKCKIQYSANASALPDIILSFDSHYRALAIKHGIWYTQDYEIATLLLDSILHVITQSHMVSRKTLPSTVKYPFKVKNILTGEELSEKEILEIVSKAKHLKRDPNRYSTLLSGKSLVMLFDKPSLRTRLSFSLAIQTLGGMIVESISDTRKSEEPKDVVRVIDKYADYIMIRTNNDNILKEMSYYSRVPLINGLSDLYHPCQILADLMTIQEYFGQLHNITVAYVGDGNNILHSLMIMAPKLGVHLKYCCPESNHPNQEIVNRWSNKKVTSALSPGEAVSQADVIYTDVWTSMGFEGKIDERKFIHFQVNEVLMKRAKPGALIMHCMPMNRGKEISIELPDSYRSIIFDQSENRLHVQKALLLFLSDMLKHIL